ncbi:hypothetical protein HaLaN_22251 [Haematococcus lacustris]|uniref:Uncharacterized protein n=1 Tax=Haematococcus lacustris TaxID=44745 RepID=A0A699ZQ93_HAELA|nr:hypothetical protein HaLaN_22251 [Haematococcus lacustris]
MSQDKPELALSTTTHWRWSLLKCCKGSSAVGQGLKDSPPINSTSCICFRFCDDLGACTLGSETGLPGSEMGVAIAMWWAEPMVFRGDNCFCGLAESAVVGW